MALIQNSEALGEQKGSATKTSSIGSGNQNGSSPGKKNGEGESHDDSTLFSGHKLRVLMITTLIIVLMTFGALVGAFLVIASNRPLEWRPFELPVQLWLSTAILLASSLAFYIGKKKLFERNEKSAHNWFRIAVALGIAFLISQIWAWIALYQMGIFLASNPFAGFFYVFTAVHGFHVVGGIGGLAYLVTKTRENSRNESIWNARKDLSAVAGWYWHLMDILWIILFLLLGFWQ